MGAGTGPQPAGGQYIVDLSFNEPVWSDDPVLTNFKSALEWIINADPCQGRIDEVPGGAGRRQVTSLHVVVAFSVAFDGAPRARFNRALNRVLWGLQHRLHDGTTERPGTPSWINAKSIPENWDLEDT